MTDMLKTRKQLLKELEEARKRIDSLREVIKQRQLEMASLLSASRSVSEFQGFPQAARSIFDIAKELIGASSGYVALLSDDGSESKVLFLDAGGLPCTVDPSLPMPIRGLRGEVYRSGRVAYDNDFAESDWQSFMPEGHVKLQNVMFAPLSIDDKVVGLIGLANKEAGFNENDSRLATVFGDLTAVALSNDYTFESLEKSEERFRSVTQSANDAIVSANAEGRIVSWNKGAREIFGYQEADVLGEELTLLMPERYREDHRHAMGRYLDTGNPRILGRTTEMHGLRQDGGEFPLELSLSTWKTNDGTFFTGIIRDITKRKRNEQFSIALNSINEAISSTLEVEGIAQIALREAARVLDSDRAFVAIPVRDGWLMQHVLGLPADLVDTLLNQNEVGMMDDAIGARAPLTASLAGEPAKRGSFSRIGMNSSLLIPLQTRDDNLGVMAVGYQEDRRDYTPEEIDFAGKLSTAISLSLKNAALFNRELESRSTCQNYANQLSVLHQVGLSLNRETDKHRLLKTVLKSAAELTAAGTGIMVLIQDGKTSLVSSYFAPWNDQRCSVDADITNLHQRVSRFLPANDRDVVRIGVDHHFRPIPEGHVGVRGLLIGIIRDTKGRTKGMFMLSNKAESADFTSADEEIISLLAAQSSVALVSAENFEREHVVAETLQEALLPDPPVRDDIDVGLLYQSAGQLGKIGGDFYDFVELENDKIAVVVGDVCGKGLAAATYTAMIKYMLRAYLGEGMFPGDCLSRLNHNTFNQVSIEKFVTVGLALIDIRAASLFYSSAGHPPPIISRKGGASALFSQPAVPLGVIPDQKFLSTQIPLSAAEALIMYTDGLIEARPLDGEPYGEQRIVECVALNHDLPAQRIAQALSDDAVGYSGGSLRDDIALLVVKLSEK